MAGFGGAAGQPASWRPRDLLRPVTLLVAVACAVGAGATTLVVSCNVHEVSHALVGSAAGWEVDQVRPCPGGAEVVYARTSGSRAVDVVESFAGGIGAATFVAITYLLVFVRGARPLRSPLAWSAGLGVLPGVGAQLFVGAAEGAGALLGADYTEVLDAHRVSALAGLGIAMAAFAALHLWLWRAVWTPRGRPGTSEGGGR